MREMINLQKQLVPDVLEIMEERFAILRQVQLLQPIGRRALSENVELTERQVRSEVDFLQEQGLLEITSNGMYATKDGEQLLEELGSFMSELKGLQVLENRIMEKLSVEEVMIVPGNSEVQEWVKEEMGKRAVEYLKSIISKDNTIAVTGGSSIAAVASVMSPLNKEGDYLFVPARGALGETVQNQATRIAEEMAKKANGNYSLLYVPDPLSEAAYQTIMKEPSIQSIVSKIKQADIVLHGVGDALKMANRRNTTREVITSLKEKEAVSEAFGYYFDEDGNVVHKVRTVGLHLEDLEEISHVITIAGGISKAKAVCSYFKAAKSNLLITDEACAKEIMNL
jgi:central glycolytic genes regulator